MPQVRLLKFMVQPVLVIIDDDPAVDITETSIQPISVTGKQLADWVERDWPAMLANLQTQVNAQYTPPPPPPPPAPVAETGIDPLDAPPSDLPPVSPPA